MNEIEKNKREEKSIPVENKLEIIEDGLRKKFLARLTDMQVVPINNLQDIQQDLIENVRVYKITEMVYEKGELATDKFTTVFNTLSTYTASVFIIMDSDGEKTDFYIGVRNNDDTPNKRSTVTLGDTLKNTLIGNFPGIKIHVEDRGNISRLSDKILSMHNIASVSVMGSPKANTDTTNEQFIQGLEKLILAMQGRQYIGIIVAENQDARTVQLLRHGYQELYTNLSPLQKIQFTDNQTSTTTRNKSFSEMDGKQKAAMLGTAVLTIGGVVGGAVGGLALGANVGMLGGSMLGGQIAGQLNGFINSLAPQENISSSQGTSTSTTTENKQITDLMQLIDDSLKRINEFDSYGMWNVAGYFVSDEMSAAEIAASNYRSLMNGETSGRELSAINSWRNTSGGEEREFKDLVTYLSRFYHPKFYYGKSDNYGVITDATTAISGKELGLHIGFPRSTTPGLPVIEHAEFGKEVHSYNLFESNDNMRPEDRMTLGKVFDLGKITEKVVELDNRSLDKHTFITGSTGSGKSNTVYQMLSELHQDQIPFLVIEPAKGEYKDVFGSWEDVNVFSTNPTVAKLINLNPFKFPDSIHVLEHIDGLVEIFSVCWPMYDAMPAFFKEAILRSYESVGWDLGSSKFEGDETEYPDFEVLAEQLDQLIGESDYASDIKSNYRGALITRVKSLAVGLNKFIFTSEQTPYETLFDQNCIIDISRVKSTETKALIMGLMVYILNEYRVDQKTANNSGLKHVTVLEEAHNLLKNKLDGGSELVGKSVEMLTQTIAEIRTYGEGFIIVDQSPSSVDLAAIKNTNTKIVLRTPEANDREAVGRSMGLTEDQVNEIAKLPGGVAVVYQNDWASPVLTMIDKANVQEQRYENKNPEEIKPLKQARTEILVALMEPWIKRERIRKKDLGEALKTIDLNRSERKKIESFIDDYAFLGGSLIWEEKDIPILQICLKGLLRITDSEFNSVLQDNDPEQLRRMIESRTTGLNPDEINEVCNVLTKVVQ